MEVVQKVRCKSEQGLFVDGLPFVHSSTGRCLWGRGRRGWDVVGPTRRVFGRRAARGRGSTRRELPSPSEGPGRGRRLDHDTDSRLLHLLQWVYSRTSTHTQPHHE